MRRPQDSLHAKAVSFSGNPAIQTLASTGPEALRRRLTTGLPLYDMSSLPTGPLRDIGPARIVPRQKAGMAIKVKEQARSDLLVQHAT